MRPSGPALRGSSSVWWPEHVIPAHEGLIDEVLKLKWSSACRSLKEPLPVRAQRWGEIFTLPSQNSANDCYEMKTNLRRMDKGRGEGLWAKFCNLISSSQEEAGEQNAPGMPFAPSTLKTSQPCFGSAGGCGLCLVLESDINRKSKCPEMLDASLHQL